ncbi:putative serine/threonine-protein kinase, partial [Drosera capensis]
MMWNKCIKYLNSGGSPSEDYWKKSKLSDATSFRRQHPYKRRVIETFRDFPPTALSLVDVLLSIELENRGNASDALASEHILFLVIHQVYRNILLQRNSDVKIRDEEARRQKAEAVKGRGPESVRRGPRESKQVRIPEFDSDGDISLKAKEDTSRGPSGLTRSSSKSVADLSVPTRRGDWISGKESSQKKVHYSGPLVPPGGNMEEMLKEHERQIQLAVRKSETRTKNNHCNRTSTDE